MSLSTFGGPKGEEKIAPGLAAALAYHEANGDFDAQIPVIIQFDPDHYHPHGAPPGLLKAKALNVIEGHAGQMSVGEIRKLAESHFVERISGDVLVQPTSNPFNETIGLEQFFVATRSLTLLGYDGDKGHSIAIFDSGLADHEDSRGKIEKQMDFTTGQGIEYKDLLDPFGHGTHVGGIIGGKGTTTKGTYARLATENKYIVVRVLGADGSGSTSHVIQAIDWVLSQQEKLKIRIANLSLGHPAFESYETDPLCQAVRAMVDAGIVTVVSAGNLGKTADHPEIWGGISSPGNDPLVITVGAVNTKNTVSHSDDAAASYSSSGPTYPDGLFKPDLVAPGNNIICPSAPSSLISQTYPELRVDENYVRLSGSSIATAVVTGIAALMLDANGSLNPNLVKLILLSTAIKMQQPSMLEQGNGMVNAKTAVELAKAVDVRTQTVADGVSPTWSLAGEYGPEEVWAGGAFAYGDQIVYGDLVQADMAGFWGEGVFWTDFLFRQDGVLLDRCPGKRRWHRDRYRYDHG